MKGRFNVGERVTGFGFWDSLWLTVPLLLAAVPLVPQLGAAVVGCFFVCAILHLRGVYVGVAFPASVRWFVFAIGLAGVYAVHNALWGTEPGMAVMLILYAVKLLEMRSRREYVILCSLTYFLLLCELFSSQEFLVCLYAVGVFFLVTAALLRFNSLEPPRGEAVPVRQRLREVFPMLRLALILSVQALPIVVILFFFFPRAPEGAFGLHFFHPPVTGMSDSLSPGSVEKLVENASLAFRVRFLSGDPPVGARYWRGVVLWQCNGLEWQKGTVADSLAPSINASAVRHRVEQEIILEPHGKRWLFALDSPVSRAVGSALEVESSSLHLGRYILAKGPIDTRQLYRVTSGVAPDLLTPNLEANALSLPRRESFASKRILALAASFTGTPEERVTAAEKYFSKDFVYTLNSGTYPGDGWRMMDEFLFKGRRGYCSHYAAAFGSLMRLCGVPCRIVMGYSGGEFNPVGGFYSLYQSDAHAWCEVWLGGKGWVRVDPTAVVTGASRAGDFKESAAVTPAAESRAAAAVSHLNIMRRIQYAWGAFNYNWAVWVLGYDHDLQQELLKWLGLGKIAISIVFACALAAVVAFLLGLSIFLRWRSRVILEPVERVYGELCRKLARLGFERGIAEPPTVYLERIASARPDLRVSLEPLFAHYIALHYAPWKVEDTFGALRAFRAGVRTQSFKNEPARGV